MHAAAAAHAAHSQIAQAAAAAALQLLPVTGKAAPGISQAMTAMNSISSAFRSPMRTSRAKWTRELT